MNREAENVAIVRRFNEAWNANDWATLEALHDPAVVIRAPEGWPEAGEFEGWEEARAQWQRLKDSWRDERAELIDVRPHGDVVLLQVRWSGHGESSGLSFDVESWSVARIRAGRIVRVEFFFESDAARARFDALTAE